MSQYRYELMDNGDLMRWTGTPLAHGDAWLARMCEARTIKAPHAFMTPRLEAHPTINPDFVHLSIKNTMFVFGCRVLQLPMHTTFIAQDNGATLVPDFRYGGGVEMKMVWRPPPSMKLVFACAGQGSPMAFNSAFVFANGEQGFWLLPLPNQYGDGRLCLGRTNHLVADTFVDFFGKVWAQFLSSQWNSDQIPDLSLSAQLFKFHASTMTPKEFSAGFAWQPMCRRINHSLMAEVCMPW